MTLVWMCFEDDVTCLQRSIARKNAPATCSIDWLMLYVQQCDQRSVAGSGRALSQGDAPLRKNTVHER